MMTRDEVIEWTKARCRESAANELNAKSRYAAGEISLEAARCVYRAEQHSRLAWRRMCQAVTDRAESRAGETILRKCSCGSMLSLERFRAGITQCSECSVSR